MLIAFMVLAVPVALAGDQVADQLVRSSMVYEDRLTGNYNAASGVVQTGVGGVRPDTG